VVGLASHANPHKIACERKKSARQNDRRRRTVMRGNIKISLSFNDLILIGLTLASGRLFQKSAALSEIAVGSREFSESAPFPGGGAETTGPALRLEEGRSVGHERPDGGKSVLLMETSGSRGSAGVRGLELREICARFRMMSFPGLRLEEGGAAFLVVEISGSRRTAVRGLELQRSAPAFG
jgi:hypothetical protein